jgi:hypothetical protein
MIYCAMLFNETKTIMQNQLWIFQIELNYQMLKIISMIFFLINWEYNWIFLITKTLINNILIKIKNIPHGLKENHLVLIL